jgi:hypothetical protein
MLIRALSSRWVLLSVVRLDKFEERGLSRACALDLAQQLFRGRGDVVGLEPKSCLQLLEWG